MNELQRGFALHAGDVPVVFAGSGAYDRLRRVWNGTVDRRPAAIARPRTDDQVARVIGLAADLGLPLAIRGGGHSIPGFSTCDGGVILDLADIAGVTVDPALRLARVGGGALLGDLDRAGAPHGLVTPAGVVSHTGAGGLTLGGGMGWLSPRFGLTIDNLLSASVVTADGRTVHASATEEPDLFWALRGGGGNFGVVTQFTYRMHDLGPTCLAQASWRPDRMSEALSSLNALAEAAPRNQTINFYVTRAGLGVRAFRSGEAPARATSALRGLGDLACGGSCDPAGPCDFLALQSSADERLRWGRRYYVRGGFLSRIEPAAAALFAEAAATSPNAECEFYVTQLGGAVSDVADGDTAYSGRAARWYWLVNAIWDDPAEDASFVTWGRGLATRLLAISAAGNYINEQGEAGQDVTLEAYGAEKLRRLQRLKARYDPDNRFRLNQNILPAP